MHHMGYLSPDFDYDLFISYAHGDFDKAGSSPLKVWSQGFAAKLVEELRLSLEGEQLVAFLDENSRPGFGIDPTRPLTDQLQQAIHGSALLVVLMSPFYLKSEWCKREANWFVAEAKRRQRGDGLLFVIRIWPTQAGDWPPEFKGEDDEMLPGFWLFDRKLAAERPKRVRPFGWEYPSEHDHTGAFRAALADIAEVVAVRLEALRKQCEERRRAEAAHRKLAEASGQTLYLYARDTYRHLWERAYDSLEQAGFQVLPSEPDPDPEVVGPEKEAKAAGERVGLLKVSDALVLLRPQPGRYFDMDLVNVGMRDRRNAREGGGGPLPCAAIDLAGVADPNDRQRRFALRSRIEWIEGGATWPSELQQRLITTVSLAHVR